MEKQMVVMVLRVLFSATLLLEEQAQVAGSVTELLRVSRSATRTTHISPVTNRSSSMSGRPLYDVFLSFRGRDTRKKFTDCLYNALSGAGIRVFRDKEEMETGEEINELLMEAIKQSKISIPVISKNYANSKSCLRELAQMLECKEEMNHIIIPIFYYVSPSNVHNCEGPFKDLAGLKKRGIDGTLVNSWKTALGKIGQLKGYHLDKKSAGSDGNVIKQIVDQVQRKLKKKDLIVTKQLVEVAPHVQNIMAKLKVGYHNGQAVKIGNTREMVLVHGISGVGKTVLAKCIYNKLHHLYDACSFLENIQADIERNGIVSVQNKLIYDLHKGNAQKFRGSNDALTHIKYRLCNMKVLVLLDDVKDRVQLRELVGEPDWFGLGSRVIVTSQRGDLLENISGAESFAHGPMEQDEALKLFCRHAFGTDSPHKKFKKLSRDIVTATHGLPLTLELVGSYLNRAKKKMWQETLEALDKASHYSVRGALEKSYNNLNANERQIFLDIACFFTGKDKRIPSYMWDDFKYFPARSIRALQTRSLVEIGENKELCMHEILKNFGREIVKKENKKPCKRSRLCDHNEALKVLQTRKGTNKVQGLRLEFGDGSNGNISFECDQYDGLQNLRFLKLDWANIWGDFEDRLLSLRWLDWQGCPKSFDVQSLNLNLQNLVILDLSRSQVDKDWRGWKLLLEEVWNEFTIFIHVFF
ncbi:disease resistance protein L6-like [Syzygium oleosum]|uniref:disease resistance protein L6-like n=1 Tax=Syzygium oleosum TaxID=219896 RepID=UPI0024BAC9C0|nr:disease resistance protein L6-like [Syzygium oleosum]